MAQSLGELLGSGTSALVLQEVQNGVVGPLTAFPGLADAAATVGVIPNAALLARAARAVAVPVVHATAENLPNGFGVNRNARLFAAARRARADNAPGSESVRPVADVYAEGDIVLPRYHGLSPLTGGPLDSLLRNLGVDTLIVAGVSLNVAITNLVYDAINRSYQVIVVSDAVAGVPVEYGKQVLQHTLAMLTTLADTDEVVRSWSAIRRRTVEGGNRAD
jgi:nicotinamidase-related amidase